MADNAKATVIAGRLRRFFIIEIRLVFPPDTHGE
jgi:hypothetical protein